MRAFRFALRRRRLGLLAGTCLAAFVAIWAAMLAGPSVPFVLTAVQNQQARVLNPGPPTGLTATAGNAQVALSWTAPASDGGSAITGYEIFVGTSSGGESATAVQTVTGTSATVTGLTNGT